MIYDFVRDKWFYSLLICMSHTFGSSRPEVFRKKGVLRNFAKLTGKHLCQSLFFKKVIGRLRPATLLEKRLTHLFLQNTYGGCFYIIIWVTIYRSLIFFHSSSHFFSASLLSVGWTSVKYLFSLQKQSLRDFLRKRFSEKYSKFTGEHQYWSVI